MARPAGRSSPSGAPGVAGLVLAPGASASRDQSALVAIDRSVSKLGVTVERIDFPYRLAGKRAPDRLPVLVDALSAAAHDLADRLGVPQESILVGGRSMGGRVGSVAVAEGLPAAGLVLVSYPLHPPGRPDRLRIEHFPSISVPCLFVSGTRDAFGTPRELETHTANIAAPVTHEWLAGGHALSGSDEKVASVVAAWITARTAA